MTLKIFSPTGRVGPISSVDVIETLPNFIVVTGKNGAGKSQLLQGISTGQIPISIDERAIKSDDICLINYDSIPRAQGSSSDIWEKEIRLFWDLFVQVRESAKAKLVQKIAGIDERLSGFSNNELYPIEQRIRFLNSLDADESLVREWTERINTIFEKFDSQLIKAINQQTTSAKVPVTRKANNKNVAQPPMPQYLLQQQLRTSRTTIEQLCETLFSQITGDLISIGFDDLAKVWPTNALGSGYFRESISIWFQKYAEAYAKHLRMTGMTALEGSMTVSVAEFVQEYGPPPWKVVNEVLLEAGIPYTVTFPNTNSSEIFQATLIHKVTKDPVDLNSLSSGEKAILFLLPKLWIVDNKLVGLPKLILFDEIDATLHPSLTRLLTSTLRKLAANNKSRVLLVTHSPSTVSLIAQEDPEAIFILSCNEDNPTRHTLSRATPENAVHELTDGIISVTSSTTFVITEASTDEIVYRAIFDALTRKGILQKSPNLVFLRASDEKDDGIGGGSGQVRSWAQKLAEAGLPNFKGLIDLDYGNPATHPIYVLDRYAIENLLLDPIFIFARLVEKRLHIDLLNSEFPEVFVNDHNLSLLNDQTDEELQRVANAVCNKVPEVKDKEGNKIEGTTQVEYLNGKRIEVPNWFLLGRGKDLHNHVIAKFDRGRDGDRAFSNLTDIGEILTKNISGFIPLSLVNLFKDLQSTSITETAPVSRQEP